MTRSRAALILSLLYIPPLGVLDNLTGSDLSLLVLYLVPIAATTWYSGAWEGAAVSLLALSTWSITNLVFPHHVDLPAGVLLVWGLAEKLIVFGLVVFLVLRIRRLLEAERKRAYSDPVTGMPNRRAFTSSLKEAKAGDRPFSLAFLEIEGFDELYDERGEAWTEDLLRGIAARSRKFASCFRYADERFAALLPEVEGPTAVRRMGALVDSLGRDVLESRGLKLAIKVGIAYCEKPAATSLPHLVRFLSEGMRGLHDKVGNRLEFFQFS